MRVRWTPSAAADLEHISSYLKEHYPGYQQPTVRRIYNVIRSLKTPPQRGRRGRVEGKREPFFPPLPYVAVHRVRESDIEVLRIWHTAQDPK
jgi:toxin ParE1/3/4